MAEATTLGLLKAVLDPVRLAVLGASVTGAVDIAAMSVSLDVPRDEIARAVGDLRSSGLLRPDGTLDSEALRTVARSLPDSSGGRGTPVEGPWSEDEAKVLGRFFAEGRLMEIPASARKRKLVVEKVALEFEPGRRYSEREVNLAIQLIHDDYAAIRRYMIDEGFMDRADGAYWRTGGRYGPPDIPNAADDDGRIPISTERDEIVLRPYEWGMIDDLIRAADDPRIPAYMGDMFASPYTRESAEKWLAIAADQKPPYQFAIYVAGDFAGGLGAFVLEAENAGVAEIGWWLNPQYWGRGIATVAVRALIDELFDKRGLERLFAPVMEPNIASARVAEKVGMRLEGIAPSHYVKSGVRMDALSFGITRSQWADR
ncbi:MAG: GNAT family N-acetyltransferase [Actinomycetota bacterium]